LAVQLPTFSVTGYDCGARLWHDGEVRAGRPVIRALRAAAFTAACALASALLHMLVGGAAIRPGPARRVRRAAILLFLTAPAALAHDRLKASSPAANAKVKSMDAIDLEFTTRMAGVNRVQLRAIPPGRTPAGSRCGPFRCGCSASLKMAM
jgi:hypothetical protein